MLLRVLVLAAFPLVCVYGADDVCTLFPKLAETNGKTVTVLGEMLVAPEDLALTGLCSEPFKVFQIWPAGLSVELDPGLDAASQGMVKSAQDGARKANSRGAFIRATAEIEGRLESGPREAGRAYGLDGRFPGKLVVTAVHQLTWHEEPRAEDLPVMSVCDLYRDLPSFRGKRVAVRGRSARTGEGAWLVANSDCPSHFETQGFVWGYDISLLGGGPTAADFNHQSRRTDLPSTQSLAARSALDVTVVGVVFTRENYYVRCQLGQLQAIGFGHLGGSAASIAFDAFLDPIIREYVQQGTQQSLRISPCK